MQSSTQSTPQLEGKIAIVTGAGRGIGRGIALLFASRGATVVLTARTAEDVETVAEEIKQAGGKALAIAGDVTDEAFVAQLFQTVEKEFGRLDILINNAGTAVFGPVEEMEVKAFRHCLELNVVAIFSCMQHGIRLMKKHGGVGKIINIGSVRSHWTEAGDGGAYNASKYGLRGMTESVARQLHASGSQIAVGSVCPGVVDTTLSNPGGQARSDWLSVETVAEAVLHAVTAPAHVNIFDITLIPIAQKPW